MQAWVSMPGVFLAEDISVLHWLWGKAVGLSSQAFGFCEGPVRPPVPGLCGHYAVADLVVGYWVSPSRMIPPACASQPALPLPSSVPCSLTSLSPHPCLWPLEPGNSLRKVWPPYCGIVAFPLRGRLRGPHKPFSALDLVPFRMPCVLLIHGGD